MKTTIYKTLLHSAMVLAGMATLPAQATVVYGAKGDPGCRWVRETSQQS